MKALLKKEKEEKLRIEKENEELKNQTVDDRVEAWKVK